MQGYFRKNLWFVKNLRLRKISTLLIFLMSLKNLNPNPLDQNHLCGLYGDTLLSKEGYFTLSWDCKINLLQEKNNIVLESSIGSTFANPHAVLELSRYVHNSLSITGKTKGDYYYRIFDHSEKKALSNIFFVKVRPHSMAMALGYFFAGLFLFIILIGIIIVQYRKHTKGEEPCRN